MYTPALPQRVVVNVQHAPQWFLIATGQTPGNRQADDRSRFEHASITAYQLRVSQPATERIVDMRIGTGLVQQHVTVSEGTDAAPKCLQKRFGMLGSKLARAYRIVLDTIFTLPILHAG